MCRDLSTFGALPTPVPPTETDFKEKPELQPPVMLQMSIAFQPPPEVVLTSREMLASERIDHVGRDLCRIRVIIPKEIVVRRGNVGEEREREVREDGHETVVFIHPGQGFSRQLVRTRDGMTSIGVVPASAPSGVCYSPREPCLASP